MRTVTPTSKTSSAGVRRLRPADVLPRCEILINASAYNLSEIAQGKRVADIGCGSGRLRSMVEQVGGTWIGVEAFDGGEKSVMGSAEYLPFADASFDVVVMNAVLEHVPNVSRSFTEVSRVLRPGGCFVGYVAFMECFHEISYSHLSFKALEHFATENGMVLEIVSGGKRFGIDYHLANLWHPLPFWRQLGKISHLIRLFMRLKASLGYFALRIGRRLPRQQARETARSYFLYQCLSQSVGFSYVIRKLECP